VIAIFETGRVKSDLTGLAADVTQFNLAWHCIRFVCKSVLRIGPASFASNVFDSSHLSGAAAKSAYSACSKSAGVAQCMGVVPRRAWQVCAIVRLAVREVLLCRLRNPLFRRVPKDVMIHILVPEIARVWAH
jgi:hypothetical protein